MLCCSILVILFTIAQCLTKIFVTKEWKRRMCNEQIAILHSIKIVRAVCDIKIAEIIKEQKLKENKRFFFFVKTQNCYSRRNRWLCASNPISMYYRKTTRESCSGYLTLSPRLSLRSQSCFKGGSDRESLRE